MAPQNTWLRNRVEAAGLGLVKGGVFLVARARRPNKWHNTLHWQCEMIRWNIARLLAEYKELGEGGVTATEGRRMREIRSELQNLKSNWDSLACSSQRLPVSDFLNSSASAPEIEELFA